MKPLRKSPPNHLIPFLERWQSNNSPDDLGVCRFIFDIYELSKRKGYPDLIRDFKPKYGVAPWARQALYEYFNFYPGMQKEDRCFAYATYREGTKTTWFSWALPLYETLVGQYGIYFQDQLFPEVDYQVLKGKTGKEAMKRLMNISSTLNKPIIHDLFGNLKPSYKQVKDKDGKDQSNLLILTNQYVFESGGIEQPIRGFNVLQMRPKKVTYDDPENYENTKTQERRKNNRNEVMQEAFGAIVDNGSLIYIGNKIHSDDTLGKLLDPKNKQWKKQFHTITYTKGPKGEKLPGKGNLETEICDWPQRDTIARIKRRKEWYEGQPDMGGLAGFLKEYYNIISSEVEFKIKEFNGEYFSKFGINWLKINTSAGPVYRNVNIYVGNDPAISEKKLSSDAVIAVIAVDGYHNRYVLEISRGKYDIRDRFFDGAVLPKIVATTPEEIKGIRRKGSAEECVRMFLKYKAQGISIETFGQQMTFYNETKQILDQLGLKPTIMPYAGRGPKGGSTDSKTGRIRQVPLAYFESGKYFIKDDMEEKPELKSEIETFPYSGLHILDAVHIAEQLVSAPKPIVWDHLGNFVLKAKKEKETPTERSNKDMEPWIVA